MIVKRMFSLSLMVMSLMLAFTVTAYADPINLKEYIAEATNTDEGDLNESTIDTVVENYIKKTGMSPIEDSSLAAAYNYYYEVDGKNYYFKSSQASNIAQNYKSTVITSEEDDLSNAKQMVKDMTNNLNLTPDVEVAGTALSGFSGVISVAIGLLIFIITLLTVLVTTCDICYITLPVFREKQDMAAAGGGSGSSFNNIVNKLISNEAKYAVKTCTMDSGKNPLATYLGKRIVAYILLALALFILLTGNISVIINIVLTGVGGIADALQALAGA